MLFLEGIVEFSIYRREQSWAWLSQGSEKKDRMFAEGMRPDVIKTADLGSLSTHCVSTHDVVTEELFPVER